MIPNRYFNLLCLFLYAIPHTVLVCHDAPLSDNDSRISGTSHPLPELAKFCTLSY